MLVTVPVNGLKKRPLPPASWTLANGSDEQASAFVPVALLAAFTDQPVGVASVWGPTEKTSSLPLDNTLALATPTLQVPRPRAAIKAGSRFIAAPLFCMI